MLDMEKETELFGSGEKDNLIDDADGLLLYEYESDEAFLIQICEWIYVSMLATFLYVPWLLLLIIPIPPYGSGLHLCSRVHIIWFPSFMLECMLTWEV
ncbi:hypothetical protein D5086_017642 [Populus alba]|uniref:Uncharacterized protein n=1 Tax=Populus alba TaxID=43335 RepID=A0ACC4BMM8_POPAL